MMLSNKYEKWLRRAILNSGKASKRVQTEFTIHILSTVLQYGWTISMDGIPIENHLEIRLKLGHSNSVWLKSVR